MQWASLTNVGKVRKNNEDSFLRRDLGDRCSFALVSDGVGGHSGGEVASQTTVETFDSVFNSGASDRLLAPELWRSLLEVTTFKAHKAVLAKGAASDAIRRMACTLTAAIADDSQVEVVQVGDSRLYHFSDGELRQVTEDQTSAMELVRAGRLELSEVATHPDRNMLSQCIGIEPSPGPFRPALYKFHWAAGDMLLLCSDGLTDPVKDVQIKAILASGDTAELMVENLVQAALDGGGPDNVTVVLGVNSEG